MNDSGAEARREARRRTWTGRVFRCGEEEAMAEAKREFWLAIPPDERASVAWQPSVEAFQLASPMSASDEALFILAAAMQLPDSERALLAAVLKDSIGDGASIAEIQAAWVTEAERTREDLRSGRTTAVEWQQVRRDILDMIRRASGAEEDGEGSLRRGNPVQKNSVSLSSSVVLWLPRGPDD